MSTKITETETMKTNLKALSFREFVTEARITDPEVAGKLGHIKELRNELGSIRTRMMEIEAELKEFDAQIKPFFDAMQMLDVRLVETEQFAIKIATYAYTRRDVSYKAVVDNALLQVDEEARAIIGECVQSAQRLVQVKHSFELEPKDEPIDESNVISKIVAHVSSMSRSFITKFRRSMSVIEKANAELKRIEMEFVKPEPNAELGDLVETGYTAWYSEISDSITNSPTNPRSSEGTIRKFFKKLNPEAVMKFLEQWSTRRVHMPIVGRFPNDRYEVLAGQANLSGMTGMGADTKVWVVDFENSPVLPKRPS